MRRNTISELDEQTAGALLDLAAGWELFHAFLLVHDDIIDDSAARRGRPSLHHELANLDGGSLQFGVNLAIVAGDLLFSAAMRLWHELDCPADVFRRELQLFSRISCTTGLGQAMDIVQSHAGNEEGGDERTLLEEYAFKTAAYTFEGPMLSAAILADLEPAAIDAVSRFSISLGQAYQVHNDLLDLDRPAQRGCDLIQGKRTIALLRARSMMSQTHRASFDRRLHSLQSENGHAVELAEALRQELLDTGAIGETRQLMSNLLATALDAASDRAVPSQLSRAMAGLIHSLSQRYFMLSPAVG
jgi:geranylgeranyl diphosphate synthase type I